MLIIEASPQCTKCSFSTRYSRPLPPAAPTRRPAAPSAAWLLPHQLAPTQSTSVHTNPSTTERGKLPSLFHTGSTVEEGIQSPTSIMGCCSGHVERSSPRSRSSGHPRSSAQDSLDHPAYRPRGQTSHLTRQSASHASTNRTIETLVKADIPARRGWHSQSLGPSHPQSCLWGSAGCSGGGYW